MKKLIKLLFISLLITGCVYQEKQQKLIKTNILKQQEIAYISNQREIKNETETVTNQEYDLPVIGNNRLIVIDAGHQR